MLEIAQNLRNFKQKGWIYIDPSRRNDTKGKFFTKTAYLMYHQP
jgi:hypothetical protein